MTSTLVEESLTAGGWSIRTLREYASSPLFRNAGALEALACGRPVVTTTAAGIAPIISENGCGIVVPPRDASALADAIERLLGDADARLEKGERGRALAERLSWDSVAEEYERLYREVLHSGRGDGP